MTAIEIACRRCAAQPNEGCAMNPDALPLEYGQCATGVFHAERIEDAAAMTDNATPVSIEAFDRAVEASGLF